MARRPKPWFRKGRGWFVTVDGKQVSLGKNKKAAYECFHRLMAASNRPSQTTQASLGNILDEFLEWTQKHRAASTYENCRLWLQSLVDSIPRNLSVSELKPFHIQAWIDIQVLFDQRDCNVCPHQDVCPASAVGRRERRWQYNHDCVRQRERRISDASEEFRERYRWRAGVEATMSRFKYQMGMARLRIRRMTKVRYVTFLRALGLNIRRVAAYRAALT